MKNAPDSSGPIAFPGMTKGKVLTALAPVFDPLVEKLKAMPPAIMSTLPESRGLYLLSERGKYLYVGITGNLRRRWQQHRYGRETGAKFAIRLARKKTGHRAKYSSSDGLKALMKRPDFVKAFVDAKIRISKMEIRFLDGIEDPDILAILEIYMARALGAPYNDFKTH